MNNEDLKIAINNAFNNLLGYPFDHLDKILSGLYVTLDKR
jgi:hypothetical protein